MSSVAAWCTDMYFRSRFEAKPKPSVYALEGPNKTDISSRDPATRLRIAQMVFRRLRRIYILFIVLVASRLIVSRLAAASQSIGKCAFAESRTEHRRPLAKQNSLSGCWKMDYWRCHLLDKYPGAPVGHFASPWERLLLIK